MSASGVESVNRRAWVRRQVFEHSFTAPLLASDLGALLNLDISRDDWVQLMSDAHANARESEGVPCITFEKMEAFFRTQANADVLLALLPEITESLMMHAPRSFSACNRHLISAQDDAMQGEQPGLSASERALEYMPSSALSVLSLVAADRPQLRIPLPEMLIFLHVALHVKALAMSGRDTVNASWVEAGPSPSAPAAPTSASPTSPMLDDRFPLSPPSSKAGGLSGAEAVDPSTPRKRAAHNSQLLMSPGVKSSALHDLIRETTIVLEQMPVVLRLLARSFTQDPKAPDADLTLAPKTLQHLQFLLTTGNRADGAMRSVTEVVPQFADAEGSDAERAPVSVDVVCDALKLALMNGANYIKQHGSASSTTALSPSKSAPQASPSKSAGGPASPSAVHAVSELEDGPKDLLEISALERKTVLRAGTDLLPIVGKDLRIANCNQCFIYLLAPLARVSLVGCVECTLFVAGACSLSIIGCGRVTVVGTTFRFRATNCMDSSFYLCTNHRPVLVGDNRGVTFAPYNAQYERFAQHSAAVHVDPRAIDWSVYFTPYLLDVKGFAVVAPDRARGLVLAPEKFVPFVVPVSADFQPSSAIVSKETAPGGGSSNSGQRELVTLPQELTLPESYRNALDAKSAQVDELRRSIKAAQAERDRLLAENGAAGGEVGEDGAAQKSGGGGGAELQAIVQEYFREWLVSSGNMRQIHDLVRLEQEFTGEKL